MRLAAALVVMLSAGAIRAEAPDFAAVAPLFEEHCADCHSDADEADGNFLVRSHADVMKGGESGAAVLPGRAQDSLLVQYIEGRVEKPGKKKIMPPGKRAKLSAEQIATLRAWIDAGARAPAVAMKPRELSIPRIAPVGTPRIPIKAMASSPGGSLLAVARGSAIELRSTATRGLAMRLEVTAGPVTALAFSGDGTSLFTAGGQPGMAGEVTVWNVASGSVVRVFPAHDDAILAMDVSPDGSLLATGSYDQRIRLWKTADGAAVRTLSGHNGAVAGLAFRPDGQILASASADRTIKLWDVATGERRDTLSQPLKEQNAVTWSHDGSRLVAVGADSRLRIWVVSREARETTNPLDRTIFAHEGAIISLARSPDRKRMVTAGNSGSVKLWESTSGELVREFEKQPDWPQALSFAGPDGLAVGRADGTIAHYRVADGAPVKPPAPVAQAVTPRAIERGRATALVLAGEKLVDLTAVRTNDARFAARIIRQPSDREVHLELTAEPALPRGTYQLWLAGAGGESARLPVEVDDVPVVHLAAHETKLDAAPATVWGTFARAGDTFDVSFSAAAGQTIVFELRDDEVQSSADVTFTVIGPAGNHLASNPASLTVASTGEHHVRLAEKTLGASPAHYFALTLGEFGFVTGVSPLVLPQGTSSKVRLLGINVPPDASVPVDTSKPGEVPVAADPSRFRWSKPPAVLVTADPAIATADVVLTDPAAWPTVRFPAQAGRAVVIEAIAARRGSPVDTRIEILWPDGKAVEQVRLQATKQTQQAFRGINSVQDSDFRVDQWEEMELRQFLYCNGEVVRLFRAPQGPDSGFVVFAHGSVRRNYFHTSASAHAVEETYYIVHPLEPGQSPQPNGLPVFTLPYANDDDSDREWGSDSRLIFRAPKDGEYVVRLSDARGFAGPDHAVHVRVREARPDFSVRIDGAGASLTPGTGTAFDVVVDRIDGFSGEIRVDFDAVPPGHSITTPLIVENDHLTASGAISAVAGAAVAGVPVTFRASARINDRDVSHSGTFGIPALKPDAKPQFTIALEPAEIIIAPGRLTSANLKVHRSGNNGILNLEVLNLPHGVIVNNIGLNGVQIAEGASEREIEFACERWVPPVESAAFPALKGGKGLQAGPPVRFRVQASDPAARAAN